MGGRREEGLCEDGGRRGRGGREGRGGEDGFDARTE